MIGISLGLCHDLEYKCYVKLNERGMEDSVTLFYVLWAAQPHAVTVTIFLDAALVAMSLIGILKDAERSTENVGRSRSERKVT